MADIEDHDSLIRLESKVESLTTIISANNIASVERDTRIEEAVKKINGTVRRHDTELQRINDGADGAKNHNEQHAEMWSAYRIGRWVGITVGSAAIIQSVGIVALLIRGG